MRYKSNTSVLALLRSLPVAMKPGKIRRFTERERFTTSAAALKDLRQMSGLSQAQSAKLSLSTLEEWRGFESGRISMHPAIYKAFLDELAALKGSQKRRRAASADAPTRKPRHEGMLPFLMYQRYTRGSEAAAPAKTHERWNASSAVLKDLRKQSGLTPSQAAKLCVATLAEWRDWESGRAQMHPAIFKTFLADLAESMGWPTRSLRGEATQRKRRTRR